MAEEKNLSQPLVALLMKPDHCLPVVSGKKKISIRKGHRDYRPRQTIVLGCCEDKPWAVIADVAEVRHCRLSEVSTKEYKDNGFKNRKEMLKGLRKYYPGLNRFSKVTVIRWSGVRGKLVDDYWNAAFKKSLGPVDSIVE